MITQQYVWSTPPMSFTRCSDCSGINPGFIAVDPVLMSLLTAEIVLWSLGRRQRNSNSRLDHSISQSFWFVIWRVACCCSDSVSILFRSVLRLSSHCFTSIMIDAPMVRSMSSDVPVMFQWCYSGVTVVFGVQIDVPVEVLNVSMMFQWCFGDAGIFRWYTTNTSDIW